MKIYRIQREIRNIIGNVPVVDKDGNEVASFPPDWQDSQIKHAMHLIDHSYSKGVESGKYLKAMEVQRVLMMKD